MVRETPKSAADVERNIAFLQRRIQEAGVQVGRKGRAARAGIPRLQAEIARLQASLQQGRIEPISAAGMGAVLAGRTTPEGSQEAVETALEIQRSVSKTQQSLAEETFTGLMSPVAASEMIETASTKDLNIPVPFQGAMPQTTFSPVGSPQMQNAFSVSAALGIGKALIGSTIGKSVLAGVATTGVIAGASALFGRNGKPVRRGTNIITKRGMKQIKRISKYRKQVSKAASALGYTLKRHGSTSVRKVC